MPINRNVEEKKKGQQKMSKAKTKQYVIYNNGCDDTTVSKIELTDEELKTVIKVFETNNSNSTYECEPEIFIYQYNEEYKTFADYYNSTALNRGRKELSEKR